MITIVLLGLALAGVGKLYLWKVEELGALNVQYEQQRGETAKAIAQYNGAVAAHEIQIEKYNLLTAERLADDTQYRKEIARIQALADSTQRAALKEPERFGRIATFNLRRSMRAVCRSGGGSASICKIDIPKSAPSNPSNTVQPDNQDDDGLAIGGSDG